MVEGQHSDHLLAHHDGDRGDLDVDQRAVFPAPLTDAGSLLPGHRLLGVGLTLGPSALGLDQLVQVDPYHLVGRVAEHRLEGGIAGGDLELAIQVHDRDRVIDDQVLEVALAGREELRVLDRDSGLRREQLEEPQVLGTKCAIGIGVDGRDHANESTSDQEGHGEAGLDRALRILRGASLPLLVAGDDEGLVRLGHPAHGAFTDRHSRPGRIRLQVVAGDDHQVVPRLVVGR